MLNTNSIPWTGLRHCGPRRNGLLPEVRRVSLALVAAGVATASPLPAAAVLASSSPQAQVAATERNDMATRLRIDAGVIQPFDQSRVAAHSSGKIAKAGGAPLTVTRSDDPVDPVYGFPTAPSGSLRWAIQYANTYCSYNPDPYGSNGPFTINFAIPEPVAPIVVASGYPMEAVNCHGTFIDGFSQPGSSQNTLAVGSNAVLKIALDGSAQSFGSGITISADDVEVRGLSIYKMPDNGISVTGPNCSGAATGPVIQGNFLGTNPAGAGGLGNSGYGISGGDGDCGGMQGMQVGGTAYSSRNTIVNNASGGIYLYGGGSVVPNRILRNDVGISPGGSSAGNGGPGLILERETGTVIGSLTDPNDSNQFFANTGQGVKVIPVQLPIAAKAAVTTSGHRFGINYTANNSAGIGFDIGGDGPDLNTSDPGDASPPQNYPDLTTVTFDTAAAEMRVVGNLPSSNTGPFTVLLFGHQFVLNHEAGNYLGQLTIPLSATTFDQTLPVTQTAAFYGSITANATSAVAGSQSSEISTAKALPVVTQDFTSLDFGGIAVGATSTRSVTVSSATGFHLLSNSTPAAGFSVSYPTCVPSVAAVGPTCTIVVTFSPTSAGASSGNVDFVSNSAGLQRISLAAVGLAPPAVTMAFSPPTVIIPASSTLTLTLSNPNTLDITGAAFTHTYVSGLVNAASPGVATTCTGGAATAVPGGNSLAFTGGTIPAGGSCTVSVSVTSAVVGSYLNTLPAGAVTTTNAGSSAASAAATLAVTAPTAALSPTSLTFTGQLVGTTSAAQTVTLSNTGTAPLAISGIVATGDFAQTNACGTSLAAGASCTISVTFTPAAAGGRTGAVTITDSATGSPRTVALSGTGTVPGVSLSAASLTFASQAVGTTSAAQSVTLSNTGTGPLAISGIVASGDFAQTNTCGTSVAAGASCTINVTFAPTASGSRSGTVTITDSAPGSPRTVALAGTGAVQPVAINWAFNPTAVIAGNTARILVTFTNPNGAPFSSSGFSQLLPVGLGLGGNPVNPASPCAGTINPIVGGPQSGFGVSGLSVPTSGACTFEVDVVSSTPATYAVSTAAGALVGSVLADSGVTNTASNTAELVVSPVPAPVLAIDPPPPGPLDFGPVTVATTSAPVNVKVSNAGNAALTFSAPFAVTGDFAQTATTCGASLPVPPDPASACTVTLVFTPTVTGVRSGTLSVASDGGSATLNLAGEGKPVPVPAISVSSGSLVFPSQTIGTPSAPQALSVTNAGTAPLAIAEVTVSGDYSAASDCLSASPLAPGATCNVNVTFTPLVNGTRTGQVTIASNDPASPSTSVALSGTGVPPPAPNASLSPTSLAFPQTTALSTGAPLVATLTNTGGTTLQIAAIDVVGGGFQVTNDCGAAVAPLASCSLRAVFAPAAAGSYLADVRIITNAPSSPTMLRLSGTAVSAPLGRLSPAPGALAFGDQVLGTTRAPLSVTVTNTGDALVSVGGTTVTGDFAVQNTCFDIRPGDSCLLRVSFTPTEEGDRRGQISLASNAANPTLTVELTGRGTPTPVPRLALSASALGFGNTLVGSSTRQPVTLTNTGGADLVLGTLSVTGDYRVAGACPATLAPRQSCGIEVTFAPTLPGQRPGEVRIPSNADSSPDKVTLSGVGCRFALTGRSFALVCSP